MKTSEQIRKLFISFMLSKNHKEVPNASLVPLNDPTVLFTTAGMHPLVPYLLGQPHPLGTRVTNVQKCLRTNDIEEVGDTTHLTFFEMLGYWSLGDYFKEEALRMSFEFFTSKDYIGFDPKRMYVTVFEGVGNVDMDEKSISTWKDIFKSVGIEAEVWNRSDFNTENLRIFPLNKKENWWGPAGETGPCGPDSEMFYWRGVGEPDFEKYVPWDDSGMFIEVGNDVFMEFNKQQDGSFVPLKNKNVDFGGGLERITMLHNFREEDGSFSMKHSVYDIDIFQNILSVIEKLSGKKYSPKDELDKETKAFRVLAEHARSSTFVLADGIVPSSKEQGYILRRLIRRMVRFALDLGIEQNFTKTLAEAVIDNMKGPYPHLEANRQKILEEIEKEEVKFRRTVKKGILYLHKKHLTAETLNDRRINSFITGKEAFDVYQEHGLPLEMIIEEIQRYVQVEHELSKEEIESLKLDFESEAKKHQELSRSGAEQKFKGGLADSSKETTKLHTTHHLLLAALQKIVDPNIKQKGSNITAERLRLDFNFDRKLTEEEIKKVEDLVNEKIEQGLEVKRLELKREKAEELGAQMEFGQKYPDIVSVYFIVSPLERGTDASASKGSGIPSAWFSAEFCGGPHVSNTSEIGEGGKKFKIQKQESVGAGIKRIKAALV